MSAPEGNSIDIEGLRHLVEVMPDALIVVGADGHIRFANPAAEALFGRAASDLVGTEVGVPLAGPDRTEVEVVRPGGSTVNAEIRVVQTSWSGDAVRLVTLRDVTDRKEAEERARQLERERRARAEAEATSKAKSEFLATMSHELRTPLNAIIGYSELLDLGVSGPLTTQQRQQIGRVTSSARHLLGLVNEVLDLAKVEAGRLAVKNAAASAREVIEAAVSIVQSAADQRDVALTADPGPEGLHFYGDAARVRQILVNLVNNAVKFTAPGGTVTITCDLIQRPERDSRLAGSGPWIRIRVIDTGIGIPAGRISSIFDPFVQVESGRTRSSEGSGLGLTISRRLARLMEGDLTARSEPGKGSTFTLFLGEANAAQRAHAAWRVGAPQMAERLQGLADIGTATIRELPAVAGAFVDRMRAESLLPSIHSLSSSQVTDHLVAYLADVASMLVALEEARGKPSRLVEESLEIQAFIAERHGRQRARLGCTADAVGREWRVLLEELERAVRRHGAGLGEESVSQALIIVERFVERGEAASVRGLEDALGEPRTPPDREVLQERPATEVAAIEPPRASPAP